jgi:hypothetical protein
MWFFSLMTFAIGILIGGIIVYINIPIDDIYTERKRTYSEYLASEV